MTPSASQRDALSLQMELALCPDARRPLVQRGRLRPLAFGQPPVLRRRRRRGRPRRRRQGIQARGAGDDSALRRDADEHARRDRARCCVETNVRSSRTAHDDTAQQNMHSTVVSLFIDFDARPRAWGHCGDSRLYVVSRRPHRCAHARPQPGAVAGRRRHARRPTRCARTRSAASCCRRSASPRTTCSGQRRRRPWPVRGRRRVPALHRRPLGIRRGRRAASDALAGAPSPQRLARRARAARCCAARRTSRATTTSPRWPSGSATAGP